MKRLEFEATLPTIQSSVKFGDGQTRIQLDVPEIYKEQAKNFLDLNGKVLRVTIEYDDAPQG